MAKASGKAAERDGAHLGADLGADVGDACRLMLERGLLAYVWLDADLRVVAREGVLADWVPLGAPAARGLPPLGGIEAALVGLRGDPTRSESIPNVAIRGVEREVPKLNVQVFWRPDAERYLVVLTREVTQTVLELELRRESQLRLLSEQRELDTSRELSRSNEELTRANRDLAEFAYVISHDLRAPLRAIRITADLLERELGPSLASGPRDNLGRLRQLSRRMGAMMSGLLDYARIGRKQDALAAVDTSRLIDDVLAGIGAAEGMAIVREGTWPRLTTLAEPLDVVLRNLIENALKHHDTKRGVVRVGCHDAGASLIFEVADDGPGIDPAYHQAIFEPFRTVAEQPGPESSGIGLALVKKTVEVVGGSIAVESEPAVRRGTTFRVTWPKVIATAA